MARQNVNKLPFENVDAEIRTEFGQYYSGVLERGVILRPATSSNVYSMVNGTILDIRNDSYHGNFLILKDNNSSTAFLYGGLFDISVNVNDSVTNHQALAKSSVFHLEIQYITTSWNYSTNISDYVNPSTWIPYTEIVGDTLYYSYNPPTPPTPPTPTIIKKSKFPWVLYANKLRNRY